jgi:hypothetical protein
MKTNLYQQNQICTLEIMHPKLHLFSRHTISPADAIRMVSQRKQSWDV